MFLYLSSALLVPYFIYHIVENSNITNRSETRYGSLTQLARTECTQATGLQLAFSSLNGM